MRAPNLERSTIDPTPKPQRPRLLWLTNLDAPYRRPVWTSVSEGGVDLDVRLLEADQALSRHQSTNRPHDWASSNDVGPYHVSRAKSFAVRRGESAFYMAIGLLGIRRFDLALLGGWESPAYWQALIEAKIARKKVIGFYESTAQSHRHSSGLVAWARRFYFHRLDAIVVPGIAARDAVLHMGIPPERVFVGFNTVDTARIRTAVENSRPLDENRGHRFLYVGQLIKRKNVGTMLTAFALVRSPGDNLTIVGDGTEREELEILVQTLGLSEAVKFEGSVDGERVFDLMVQHQTLVMPSITEVWGMVAAEGLAAGMQVVVSKSAGIAQSIEGMRGVFLAGLDEEAIAEALSTSREQWTERIDSPEILKQGPSSFADTFRDAFDFALNR